VRTTITKSSPVGTAELSPGRSRGSAGATEKSRRNDWKSCRNLALNSGSESGILNRGIFRDGSALGAPPGNSSRPYGTYRLSNLYPGLRPGLGSAVPAGLGAETDSTQIRFFTEDRLIFSFYSPIVVAMRALSFPKSCVVCCKKCGHDVLAGTASFPASSIFVVCSLCGEKRKYLPSEVIHGRPHFAVRRRRARHLPVDGRRGPVAAHLGPLRSEPMAAGRGR
jgi:hypothetical protein